MSWDVAFFPDAGPGVRSLNDLPQGVLNTAYDCSTGEFRDPSGAGESGYGAWRAYRDRVIGESSP